MGTPILLVVDEDRAVLEALSGDLGRRFGIDTRSSPSRPRPGALAVFHRLAEASQQVALVFAGQQMTEMAGVEFLVAAHGLHPAAKRVLRLERGDDTAANPAVRAMTLGQIDYHLFTPWPPAERCRTGPIPTTPRPAASCSGRPARTAAGCRWWSSASGGCWSTLPCRAGRAARGQCPPRAHHLRPGRRRRRSGRAGGGGLGGVRGAADAGGGAGGVRGPGRDQLPERSTWPSTPPRSPCWSAATRSAPPCRTT